MSVARDGMLEAGGVSVVVSGIFRLLIRSRLSKLGEGDLAWRDRWALAYFAFALLKHYA
jgi:hypothetical protein